MSHSSRGEATGATDGYSKGNITIIIIGIVIILKYE